MSCEKRSLFCVQILPSNNTVIHETSRGGERDLIQNLFTGSHIIYIYVGVFTNSLWCIFSFVFCACERDFELTVPLDQ